MGGLDDLFLLLSGKRSGGKCPVRTAGFAHEQHLFRGGVVTVFERVYLFRREFGMKYRVGRTHCHAMPARDAVFYVLYFYCGAFCFLCDDLLRAYSCALAAFNAGTRVDT